MVQGRYEEYPDIPEYADRRQLAQSMLEKARSLWWQTGVAAAQTRQDFDRDVTTFYCIHIKEISGRCATPTRRTQLVLNPVLIGGCAIIHLTQAGPGTNWRRGNGCQA